LSSVLAVNTSKKMLATYPTTTPTNAQPIKAIVGLRPNFALIGNATTKPIIPPARPANKRLCTIFLLIESSVRFGRKMLRLRVQATPEIT
jgi:hypothetical protein